MTTLLTKLLTVLWPFLKESLLGLNNHPHKNRRGKSNNQVSTILVLVALSVFLGDYSLKLQTEIEKLKFEIIDLKNPKDFLQTQMEFHLCKKDLENIASQLTRSNSDLQSSRESCEAKLEKVSQGLNRIQTRPPVAITESAKQRAMRKLDQLKSDEVED